MQASIARLDALDAALGAAPKSADLNGILLRTGQISALLAHQALDAEDALISGQGTATRPAQNRAWTSPCCSAAPSMDPGWLAERTPLVRPTRGLDAAHQLALDPARYRRG